MDNNSPSHKSSADLQSPVVGRNSSRTRLKAAVVMAVFILLFVLAFELFHGNSTKTTPKAVVSAAHVATVQITAKGFEPETLKVKIGTRVTWNNTDNALHQIASNPYPANNGLRGFVGGGIESGQSYSYKFTKIGDFGYHDQQNPTKFLGQVDVSN